MASFINPFIIDNTYPIPGQDNDTQGFRNNYTNIRTNFTIAAAEITALQANLVTLGGAAGNLIASNASITSNTISVNSVTGALIVSGGAGIAGNLNIAGNISVGSNLSYADLFVSESIVGNTNLYIQEIIQNKNSGAIASADLVLSNDVGTATTYYADLGINSSTFSGAGAFNQPNAVFLTSTTSDLAIGTTAANVIHFVTNSAVTDALTIFANSVVSASGNVIVTGNLQGNYGTVNTNYLYLVRPTAANVIANLTTTTYYLDSAASGVIAAQTITLPTVAEDGRTLTFAALCPITATTTIGGNVKYMWSNVFATGNVVAKLQWSSGQSAWLRFQ